MSVLSTISVSLYVVLQINLGPLFSAVIVGISLILLLFLQAVADGYGDDEDEESKQVAIGGVAEGRIGGTEATLALADAESVSSQDGEGDGSVVAIQVEGKGASAGVRGATGGSDGGEDGIATIAVRTCDNCGAPQTTTDGNTCWNCGRRPTNRDQLGSSDQVLQESATRPSHESNVSRGEHPFGMEKPIASERKGDRTTADNSIFGSGPDRDSTDEGSEDDQPDEPDKTATLIGRIQGWFVGLASVAKDRRYTIGGVVAIAAIVWGGTTFTVSGTIPLRAVIGVTAASCIAVFAAGVATLFTLTESPTHTTWGAFPAGVSAAALPPVTIAVVTSRLSGVLRFTDQMVTTILEDLFPTIVAVPISRAFELEGITYLLVWLLFSIPVGWTLAIGTRMGEALTIYVARARRRDQSDRPDSEEEQVETHPSPESHD